MRILLSPKHTKSIVVALFFGGVLLLGALVFQDYGMSWDEVNNHLNGLVGLKYLAQQFLPALAQHQAQQHPWIPDLRDFPDSDHGALFEMIVALLGYLFTDQDSQSVYLLRHGAVFLVFMVGVWAVYQLAARRFADWRWGLLAALLLVISPRFFAEAFYNGKDIVFMALFALAMHTLVSLMAHPTPGRALVHALATAAAVDIRVQGLQLLLFTLLFLLLETRVQPVAQRSSYLQALSWYGPAVLGFTVAGWPYLWAVSPLELVRRIPQISHYSWPFTTLYCGEFYSSKALPWHYLPVWMGITIPLPYSLGALLGLGLSIRQGILQRPSHFAKRFDALFCVWLVVPMCFVVGFHAALYEGWRHLYFIYPALLLLAVRGIHTAYELAHTSGRWRWLGWAAVGATGFGTAHTAVWMVRAHPNQQVYFSWLPTTQAERLFERDYWGLSYRQGLEWILQHDTASHIAVSVPWHYPLHNNLLIIPPAARARIRFVPHSSPDCKYYITAYRWHPQPYGDSLGHEVFTVHADALKILSVFACKPTSYY